MSAPKIPITTLPAETSTIGGIFGPKSINDVIRKNTMKNEVEALRNDLEKLAEDARALMAATTDAVGDKAEEARKRLTSALAKAKETCGHVREKVIDTGRCLNQNAHEYPYQAIGMAVGAGFLIGLLLGRKRS